MNEELTKEEWEMLVRLNQGHVPYNEQTKKVLDSLKTKGLAEEEAPQR